VDDDDECLDVVEDEEVPLEALDPPSGRNIPYLLLLLPSTNLTNSRQSVGLSMDVNIN
jgi:hypothetical protein